jgi:predicted alpha/beta superfamily hydrolase
LINLESKEWLPYAEVHPSDHHTVSGTILVRSQVHSPQLDNRRDILVYLPPSYFSTDRQYPVIYMQDGQNLFDAATSFAGVEWQVDETLEALSDEGVEAIAVGIPNMGERRVNEYAPRNNPWWPSVGDRYVSFIAETLKPMIDRDFRTLADRAHTGIFGSSLGGLISLYAFFTRCDIFGLVGAMSPAFWVGRGVIYEGVPEAPFAPGRIYLDNGTHEASAQRMVDLLTAKGYGLHRELKYVVEPDGRHHESAWARRLPDALRFLLK